MSFAELENLDRPAAWVSLDGRILRANSAFCELLGYSEAELQALRVRDITHPDDHSQSVSTVDRALRQQSEVEVFKRYRQRNGKVVWTLLRTTLKRDSQGRPIHFVSFLEDFTHRLEQDSVVGVLARRIQTQDERFKSDLGQRLHDDLGQLLSALGSELHWLSEQLPDHGCPRLQHSAQLVSHLQKQLRSLWLELGPMMLDELGLPAALEWLIQQICSPAKLVCHFTSPAPFARLDRETSLGIFRLCQQSLESAVLDSNTQHIVLKLENLPGQIHLHMATPGHQMPAQLVGWLEERIHLLKGSADWKGEGWSVHINVPDFVTDSRQVPPHWS